MRNEQTVLAEKPQYIPQYEPKENKTPKPKSSYKIWERMLALTVILNVVLITGAVFLCYRLSNSVFTVEYLRRSMLETQQDIWKLNTDLEMATNQKMQSLLGNADYAKSLTSIGQR